MSRRKIEIKVADTTEARALDEAITIGDYMAKEGLPYEVNWVLAAVVDMIEVKS